jgi:mannose-6-phosphate isomerase-like protein (cupin superfamily)
VSQSGFQRHIKESAMDDFPAFMKSAANRIASSSQATPGVEGYVFDGADGSQMAFWTCRESAVSAPHVHNYDEYMLVVQGCYTLLFHGPCAPGASAPSGATSVPVHAGQEYLISKGQWHSGKPTAGTRTIHCFGGHRAERTPG